MHLTLLATLFALAASAVPLRAQCGEYGTEFADTDLANDVYALAVFDDGNGPALYAAGRFLYSGGAAVERVARWNGAAWSALPGGGVNGDVHALQVYDDGSGAALYAGGSFTQAAGTTANGLARWNGSAWSPLGTGVGGPVGVRCMTVFDLGAGPELVFGGYFTTVGGVPASRVGRWNGTTLAPFSTHTINAWVSSIIVGDLGAGPELFIGGFFSQINGQTRNQVARWTGTTWAPLGLGIDPLSNNNVYSLAIYDAGAGPELYVGGEFRRVSGIETPSLGRWNGTSWSAVGAGFCCGSGTSWPEVNALSVFDDGSGPQLYATGRFSSASNVAGTTNVARWNGTAWSSVAGNALGITGRALAQYDDGLGGGARLFVAGYQDAGLSDRGRIRRLDAGAWSALQFGQGLGGTANEMTVFDDGSGQGPRLLVAGPTSAGPSTTGPVVAWNGTSWATFGTPVATPSALRVDDFGGGPELYAATTVAVQRWTGASWVNFGTVAGTVMPRLSDLGSFDDGTGPSLYVGGLFTTIAGVPATGLARWNGTSWSAVGGGVDYAAYEFAVYDDGAGPALFVGGDFFFAGGNFAQSIARWNGTSWSALGTGLSGGQIPFVYALAVFDDGGGPALHVAGRFSHAGGLLVNNVARWNGSSWSPLGAGVDGEVNDLAVYDDGTGPALYACGMFANAGGAPASRLARWDGASWSAVGAGIPSPGVPNALSVFDDGHGGPALFVVGNFAEAGGTSSRSIARWQGCRRTSFCSGDGTLATPCPCGNSGAPGRGCAWSGNLAGGLLEAPGRLAPDTIVLQASGMAASAGATIFLKGDDLDANGLVFGDGVRCVAGNLIRLAIKTNVGGAAQFPEPGNQPVSVRGGTPPGSGALATYQVYFRTASPSFCPPATFNVTNGIRVVW